MTKVFRMLGQGFSRYSQQRISLATLSLALLYLTVLSFGMLMTAFLKWAGMPEALLGFARGIGAVFGVTATFVFPCFRARFGVDKTGMVSAWMQLTCLLPCLIAAGYATGGVHEWDAAAVSCSPYVTYVSRVSRCFTSAIS